MVESGRALSGNDSGGPQAERDHERVRALLGREPGGRYDIVLRDADGGPVVIRNAPLLDDGTPMPTRYWLVGRAELTAVSRLESTGGVRAAEAAVDRSELAAAHARYAAERDADLPPDADPRPSGGVAGTRHGVKCLHAHYAWHLAGGDDPVGRWVADQLAASLTVEITADQVIVGHAGWTTTLPVSPRSLIDGELSAHDPPSPASLTNALGLVSDHLDDILRERPAIIDSRRVTFSGSEAWHLACVEQGTSDHVVPVAIPRDDLEDLFRTLATEPRRDRRHNPALIAERVDLIVATCCTTLAVMRRMWFTEAVFLPASFGAR